MGPYYHRLFASFCSSRGGFDGSVSPLPPCGGASFPDFATTILARHEPSLIFIRKEGDQGRSRPKSLFQPFSPLFLADACARSRQRYQFVLRGPRSKGSLCGFHQTQQHKISNYPHVDNGRPLIWGWAAELSPKGSFHQKLAQPRLLNFTFGLAKVFSRSGSFLSSSTLVLNSQLKNFW